MKKNFMTGLAIILPLVLTILILMFLINFLTKPFMGFVEAILSRYDLLDHPFFIFSGNDILVFSSKIIILLLIFGIAILIGFVAQIFIIDYLFRIGDKLIHAIPLINKLYKGIQDTIHTLFNSKGTSFSQVVLVPFPYSSTYCIGFLTNEASADSDPEHRDRVSIFVPGTPNPTMGFMLMFRKDQLIVMDMKVEEAFKFLMSCGVVLSEFKPIGPFQDQVKPTEESHA